MKRFFITSCGTGIGKTLVTAALCHQWRAAGKKVAALKPVASGYDVGDPFSDTAILLQSAGLPADVAATISPWRYALPLAPAMAARQEGSPVDMAALLSFCRTAQADLVLVEGIGGVMAPLNDDQTVLDWMEALGWPVIMVSGTYVGALSHALTAAAALQSRGLRIAALIVSESDASAASLDETAALLEKFFPAHIPLAKIPRISINDAWRHAPQLGWIGEL